MKVEAMLAIGGYLMVFGGTWLVASLGAALLVGGALLLAAAVGRVRVG